MCAFQSNDGYLSWNQFVEEGNEFLKVSQILKDDWKSEVVDANPFGFYLSKTNLQTIQGDFEDELQDCDPQEVINNVRIIKFDYHVVYSQSYSTPVLYFRAVNSDGSFLKLEEIWDFIAETQKMDTNSDDKYSVYAKMITQMEHSLLCKPYFTFHPCQTPIFMKQIWQCLPNPSRNYILSWLSTIAPFVGLKMPNEYVSTLHKVKESRI